MDNVALVFLVKRSLHRDGIEFGMLSATFGAGMVAASVALARWARRRPGPFWLIGGVISGAAGAIATGLAPTAALAGAAQAVAGAGNSADLVGNPGTRTARPGYCGCRPGARAVRVATHHDRGSGTSTRSPDLRIWRDDCRP